MSAGEPIAPTWRNAEHGVELYLGDCLVDARPKHEQPDMLTKRGRTDGIQRVSQVQAHRVESGRV